MFEYWIMFVVLMSAWYNEKKDTYDVKLASPYIFNFTHLSSKSEQSLAPIK